MVVGIKDAAKLIGISITSCCAVLICTLFLNYYLDITSIENDIASESVMMLYQAMVSTAKVVCILSGGCLLATSIVMLLFYIKHYIDSHKKELGILKALGYQPLQVAKHFWVFGIDVFIGGIIGYGCAFLIMPIFYFGQNKDQILPPVAIGFHPIVLISLVLVPTAAFAVLAIIYADRKLKKQVLLLLMDIPQAPSKIKLSDPRNRKVADSSFIENLRYTTLKSKKVLVFFIFFSSFCFSALTQMSFGMIELASDLVAVTTLLIGLILAITTLILAITTVINGNTKTIAIMRVFGYTQNECTRALLGGYRPASYLGFAVGTLYQYILMRMVVSLVFKDIAIVPAYQFNLPIMFLSLLLFVITYEIVMHFYSAKIKNISVKEIMLE
jgi:ABC-type antimicrobial peptide transport system permease subunit